MLDKPLEQITLADLEELVREAIPEGKTLDYKRDMYGRNDPEKKETLTGRFGSSVFKCKTSRIGPSGPWPSGGCARSSSPIALRRPIQVQDQSVPQTLR